MPRTKAFNETDVLKKAMDLFWRQGYHATSMGDLVEHLGINRASLYGTFGSKQKLFNQAFQLYRESNKAGMVQLMEGHATVQESMRALFEYAIVDTVQDAERKGCFVVNTVTAMTPGDPDLQGVLEENQAYFVDFFESQLRAGEEQGDIPAGRDLRGLAMMLFTLYNGIKVVGKVSPNAADLKASVNAALRLLD